MRADTKSTDLLAKQSYQAVHHNLLRSTRSMTSSEEILNASQQLRRQGKTLEALKTLSDGLHRYLSDASLLQEKGNLLRSLGRHGEALAALAEAAKLCPLEPAHWLNFGVTYLELDKPGEALECFNKALALSPDLPEAHNIAACALLALGKSSVARAHLEKALALKPAYPAALDNLGRCLRAQGFMEEAIQHYEEALALKEDAQTRSNLLLALNYLPTLARSEKVEQHRKWSLLHTPAPKPEGEAPKRMVSPRAGRLRIAYVSGDLCRHAVSFFLAPVLSNHDRSRFEVTCYNNTLHHDPTTSRLKSLCEQWRDVAKLSDQQLVKLIREDSIDLLIDLSGHSARNRLGVFAQKPAQLQLTWLGYPATTGLEAIDYRITDSNCCPQGDDRLHGTEKLLRLPKVFCCYEPPAETPDLAQLGTSAYNSPPVFCSFSNLAKLSSPTLELWARLLKSIPGSTLLIKSPGSDDTAAQSRITEPFEKKGVSANRIHFHSQRLPIAAHLSLYSQCSIALDPFPYNGTTTTCEALLMGVPVVTMEGDTHVSRVGVSFLRSLGLTELIAADENEYLEIASNLAADFTRLAILRATLRERLLQSALCKAQTFTHCYESALINLVLEHTKT